MGTATSKQPHPQPPPHNQPSLLTPPETFTCEICIEPIGSNQIFNNNHQCDHSFCTECVAKYITLKVTEDLAYDVTCPGPTCEYKLDPLMCQEHLSQDTFIKWCDHLCQEAVLGLDRCYCPYRDCSTMVISECAGEVQKAKCPNCKKLFCFKCGLTWHAGYKCEETSEIRDRNDVKFGVLAEQKKWMRCPKCRHCVELVAGCDIVKCRCRTHFCYKCGKMIKDLCNCRVSDRDRDEQRDEPNMRDADETIDAILFILSIIFILAVLIAGALKHGKA